MHPRVEVTAFESVYTPPGADMEQQERLGPGYGEECNGEGFRIVRGKLVRLLNPSGHFSIAAPPGACGETDDASSKGGKCGGGMIGYWRDNT